MPGVRAVRPKSAARLDGLVNGGAGLDGGLQIAGVAHHVAVWEIEADLQAPLPSDDVPPHSKPPVD